ncbi:MAG: TolC family protein [Myxococcales bacterium]|nr:TolC family protein [Myxococcales bacterium]
MVSFARSLLALTVAGGAGCRPSSPPALPTTLAASPRPVDTIDKLTHAEALDRHRLVCAVLTRNPDLAAANEAIRAAGARARQPTSIGDTSVSYAFAPISIGGTHRFGQVVTVEQSFRPGQVRFERAVARSEAVATEKRYEVARNELAWTAAALFDAYYATARGLETNAEHRALLTELHDVAVRRYTAGLASRQDPLQAEVELARTDETRSQLTAELAVVTAEINGLLHQPIDTPLPPPPPRLVTDEGPSPAQQRPVTAPDRPEVEAAEADAHARAQAVTLARRRYTPQLSVMASYNSMWDAAPHRFMVGLGIRLPLQLGALRAGVEEAEALGRQAKLAELAVRDRVAVEAGGARARVLAAHEVMQLYRERLIPTARDRIDAARTGYESGKNDFAALIDAERGLRDLELGLHRAVADLDRAHAELQYALGVVPPCEEKGGAR